MATLARQWVEQGIEQGIEQGLLSSIRTGLKTRFGAIGEAYSEELSAIHDPHKLQQMVGALFEVATLTEFQERCRNILAENGSTIGTHLN